MIEVCLNDAIKELENLIEFTKEDIKLIKSAKHDEVIKRVAKKEYLLKSFEMKKSKLNLELENSLSNSKRDIEELFDKHENILLDEFKQRLVLLKELNRDFMAIVVVVKEFYQSLFSKLFSVEQNGYGAGYSASTSLFKVSA